MNKKVVAVIIIVSMLIVGGLLMTLRGLMNQPKATQQDSVPPPENEEGEPDTGPLASINITPSSVNLTAGSSKIFSVDGRDAKGNWVKVTPVWSLLGEGLLDQNGTFTATKVGSCVIYANASNISGSASVNVLSGTVVRILIDPPSIILVAGTVQNFTAEMYDAYDNPVIAVPVWNTTGGGTMDTTGNYSAMTVGEWQVHATFSNISAQANVTVTPGPLSELSIDPASATLVAGEIRYFNATGHDRLNNSVQFETSWTMDGGGFLEDIAGMAKFTARNVGEWRLRANVSGIVANATVTVLPGPLSSIFIVPTSSELMAGDEETFTAIGSDNYGNPVDFTPSWTISGGGSLNVTHGNATFSARTVGSWNITANATGVVKTVPITVVHGPLYNISVNPPNVSIIVGQQVSFTANGSDAWGNKVAITPNWTVNGGGQMLPNGTFKANKAGNWTARANVSSVQAFACVDVKPIQKGGRILSMDVNYAQDLNFDNAMTVARNAGMQATTLSLPWDMIEPNVGTYNSTFLDIANVYYPAWGVPLSLHIGPIDTNIKRVPADLVNCEFDNTTFIDRFNAMLDFTFSKIPALNLTSLAIGNEVDIYMGTNTTMWNKYRTFLEATMAHARTLRADLTIGVKTTFPGLTGFAKDQIIGLNAHTDVIMFCYYPMNPDGTVRDPSVVAADFDLVTSIYPYRTFYIMETGYPSNATCNSSLQKQADFVRNIFWAWDNHTDQIKLINFVWLHDISPATLEDYKNYYGNSDAKFLAYLASLGMREYAGSGSDKPAFVALREEARARGW